MNRVALAPLLVLLAAQARGQRVVSAADCTCANDGRAVQNVPLHSDSLASSFLLCITGEVPLHLHRTHTEHVSVLDGEGLMTLGDTVFTVRAGQVLTIPKGTPHAVKRTGPEPLKVLSVQAPWSDGTDRVFLDPPKR